MKSASPRALKILAATTWYVGASVLLVKGVELFEEANRLDPERLWILPAAGIGLILGTAKGFTLFRKSCRANLTRIENLQPPRPWLFFRPRFFLFLFLMILAGATLSRIAHGNYAFLVAVGVLDISIGIALMLSSLEFWRGTR